MHSEDEVNNYERREYPKENMGTWEDYNFTEGAIPSDNKWIKGEPTYFISSHDEKLSHNHTWVLFGN